MSTPFDMLRGFSYAQQMGEEGRQRGLATYVNRLAGEAYGAAPEQRQPALARLIGADAGTGTQMASYLEQGDEAKRKRQAETLARHARVAAQLPPDQLAQAWPTLRARVMADDPELGAMLSEQYDEATVRPILAQFAGQGDANALPSSVREAQAFRADPSLLETRRQMYGSYSYGEVKLPDDTVAQTRRNSRTGQMEMVLPGGQVVPMAGATPTGVGQPQGDPAPAADPGARREYTAQYAPGEEADPFAQLPEQEQQLAMRMTEAGMQFTVQNGRVVPGGAAPKPGFGPNGAPPATPQPAPAPTQRLPSINEIGGGPIQPLPGSGRGGAGFGASFDQQAAAKAREAAMVEQAKIAAQQAAAPRQAQLDADREAAVTSARSGATNQAKRDAVQATNNTAFAQYTAARDTLLADLKGTMTGPVAGRIPAFTERQQIAEGAQARMAPILKGLFRTAGEGTFTDKDQELLMAMVPTRTDLPGAVDAKIAGIDAIIQAKLQQTPTQAESPGSQQASGQYSQMSDDELKRALGL